MFKKSIGAKLTYSTKDAVVMHSSDARGLTYICTVKDGEAYIAEAIDSMFYSDPDCAAIVVDDGSRDNTCHVLRSLRSKYQHLNVVETDGIGRGAALNKAWRLAKSEFIANLDADDLALPGRPAMLRWLRTAGSNVAVCGGATMKWQGRGQAPVSTGCGEGEYSSVVRKLHRSNPLNHGAVIIRKKALECVGGYDESRAGQFDYDLWVRLAAAGFDLIRCPRRIGVKRIHDGQSFESRNHVQYVFSSVFVQGRAADTYAKKLEWVLLGSLRVIWCFVPSWARRGLLKRNAR